MLPTFRTFKRAGAPQHSPALPSEPEASEMSEAENEQPTEPTPTEGGQPTEPTPAPAETAPSAKTGEGYHVSDLPEGAKPDPLGDSSLTAKERAEATSGE